MAKVLFTVQYEINPDNRESYLTSMRELKTLMKADGLENYSVYEVRGKANHFEEVFAFSSEETYDNYDDADDERINILLSKIEKLKKQGSTKYSTCVEI